METYGSRDMNKSQMTINTESGIVNMLHGYDISVMFLNLLAHNSEMC
jgi:hypothetical protein